ncbi:MAG TPA: hypothetical protein VL614_14870 [Acetobacteraceae bacterium]|jgi:hypothetical protein|nr:hypothetical protein [Acetobacteraceae bacterium]
MTAFTITTTVGGKAFPITGFDITSGVFGSVGHMTSTSSITMLTSLGIDLYSMAANATAPVEITVAITADQGPAQLIFGGEYLDADWDYDRDSVSIHARDWAGQLVDQKRVLTNIAAGVEKLLAPLAPGKDPASLGTSNVNQTLAQIVTSIAGQFGMTPVLNLTGGLPGNTKIGTLYGTTDQTFLATPQSLWEILNQLARDTGYDVYVTPQKQLVFGQAGAGLTPLNLTWKTNPVPNGAVPCRDLHIQHHPRRNATFRVVVFSYDPAKAQQTTGYATVIGANMAGSAGLKPGIWVGPDAVAANAKLANVKEGGISSTQVPLYSFRSDGLTQAQATARAQTIAIDIAKRELILSCEIDGYPGATPTQPVNISGQVDPNFAGNGFYLNGFQHRFVMPKGDAQGGGLITRIKALDIPTLGTGATGNSDGPAI